MFERRVAERPWVIALAISLLVVGLSACHAEDPPPIPVNVFIIVVDTLRHDHLADHGYERPTDVGLSAFRAQATDYRNAYAPAPWTSPSIASLFTGLLPARHSTNDMGTRLPEELLTLAEMLRSEGWHTSGYSFNHNISAKTGFRQGFDRFEDLPGGAGGYADIALMMKRVESWLRQSPPEPFFFYLQPMNVHGPYRVPEADRDVLLGRAPSDLFEFRGERMQKITALRDGTPRETPPPEYIQSLRDQYDTAIRYSLDHIGRFFDLLEELQLYDGALIIVTSDHGEELYDHEGLAHGYTLYDEVLRVPLYVKMPHQRARAVSEARVNLVDLLPTVLDAAGIVPPGDLDGVSLQREPRSRQLFQADWALRCEATGMLDGNFKLVDVKRSHEWPDGQVLLFDVEKDPGETMNLALQRPALLKELADRMQAEFARLKARGAPPVEYVRQKLDKDRLKALGYIDD